MTATTLSGQVFMTGRALFPPLHLRLAPAMDVSIPDALLEDLLKASRVHCFLAARNEDDGAQIDDAEFGTLGITELQLSDVPVLLVITTNLAAQLAGRAVDSPLHVA